MAVFVAQEANEWVLLLAIQSILRHGVVVVMQDDHLLADALVGPDVKFLVVIFVAVLYEIRLDQHPSLCKRSTYLDAQFIDLVASKYQVFLVARASGYLQLEDSAVRKGGAEFGLFEQLDFRFLLWSLPKVQSVAGFFLQSIVLFLLLFLPLDVVSN